MPATQSHTTELSVLENSLAGATSPRERAIYLERLIRITIYIDPERARGLLDQLRETYAATPDDLPFAFHLLRANLASLEYDHAAALPDLERAIARVDQFGDITERIEVYLDYVGVLMNLNRMDQARDFFGKSSRLLESYPDNRLRARAMIREGFLYMLSHSYPKATPLFLEADGILSSLKDLSIKDHYFYTLLHGGLGQLRLRPGSLDKAAASFRKAIARCEEKGLRSRLAWHQLRLADALTSNAGYEEAIAIYQDIIAHEGYGSRQPMAAACLHQGISRYLYVENTKISEVTALLDRAEAIFVSLPNPDTENLSSLKIFRAQLSLDRGDFATAIISLQRSLLELEPDQNPDNPHIVGPSAEICRMLSECYAETDDYRTAYEYRLLFDFYDKQHDELEDNRQQEIFAARFDAAAWEKERESLQLRASQLQLRALRAQMNPHFLFNALNSIQSFITTNKASTASRYLAKFAMLMRRSLEYSNREFISLEDEVQFLTEYLDVNCKLRFSERLRYSIDVSPELEEDIIGVPTMIVQPYVENAIEHGLRSRQVGKITVTFSPDPLDAESILAVISDDGVGREHIAKMQALDSTRSQHQSRGTSITQSRLELLADSGEERVTIEDLYEKDGTSAGTRVSVRIPVVDVVPRRG